MTKNSNPDYLNGVPELLVLGLLAGRPMYGYQLVQAIQRRTGQVLEFGEGCVYPVLHRLEADGHLAARRETANGRSRVVYRLTAAGKKRLAGSTATWRSIVGAVNQVLLEQKMNTPQLREQFAAELRRHRLPRAYIQRLLDEWDDHLADFQDERNRQMTDAKTPNSTDPQNQSAEIINFEIRLGDPTQLAAIAAKHYYNRSFLGRHPIFTFLVLPLPLIVLFTTIVVSSTIPISYVFDWLVPHLDQSAPLVLASIMAFFFWAFVVIPSLGTMLFVCRIGRRNSLRWRWPIFACILVAWYCSQIFVKWNYIPTQPGDKGMMMVGWEFIPTSVSRALLHFLPKFALAMCVGLLLIKRAQRLQQLHEVRQEDATFRQAA